MSPIRGGGFDPLPLKKVDFFIQDVKNVPHALKENPFLLKQFVCIVTPSLSTGSNEIHIYKNRIHVTPIS